jgi:hypothetical protein
VENASIVTPANTQSGVSSKLIVFPITIDRDATEEVLNGFRQTLEKINDGRSKTDTTIINYR